MKPLKKKKNNPNMLFVFAAHVLSILSVFAIGKTDNAHADWGRGNSSHDNDGLSSHSGDMAYVSIGETEVDDQWGGGGIPRPE